MPNRKYEKGARHERELVNKYREAGGISARSAGSHSPIDVWAIKDGELHLIQVKGDKQNVSIPVFYKNLSVRKFLAYKKKGKWVFDEL